MTAFDVRSAEVSPLTGRLVFEAHLTGAPAVRVPGWLLTPDVIDGAYAADGTLARLTVAGPVVGGDPRDRAHWEWSVNSPDLDRDPSMMPAEVLALVEELRPLVRL